MKVYVVVSLARQVNGEYCASKVEKVFSDPKLVEKYNTTIKYTEVIQTATGPMPCVVERAIFPCEVDE